MTDLRTAAQQALEALKVATTPLATDRQEVLRAQDALRAALAQQDEPVEPVAWLVMDESGYVQHAASWRDAAHEHINDAINEHDLVCARTWRVVPVYTTPSQRLPLTDEEILKAIGWERAEMYMKLTPNFPVAEAKKETLKNARAIERAHGIGGTK